MNHHDIGDQNVERLLGQVYKPETPDPVFVRRVEEHLSATARELAQARQSSVSPSAGRSFSHRLAWVAQLAAALAILMVSLHFLPEHPQDPDAWANRVTTRTARPSFAPNGLGGLTPRPRPVVRVTPAIQVGEQIQTQPGQRRHVSLPDGSVLYVNQRTRVQVDGERHLNLQSGEVFVEVAPREPDSQDPPFTVHTPDREVSARGTRFAVTAGAAGTGVLVTQGTVRVAGLDDLVRAGQQLAPGTTALAPAPRASHALSWTKDLVAAAESPLVPGSKYAGGALIAVDPAGQESNLSLRKYHIDVHVEDGFARTTIDQTYFNHTPARLEGTFYFPLPPDASLSRLAMYVDGRLMEGGMAERDHARQVFETILYTKRDPALLEWVDGSTFKMRVFPLEGRQEKRIILSYTQRLESLYGQTCYRFPAGHNLEVVGAWSFHARVKGGAEFAWSSPSHPELKAAKPNGDLLLDVAADHVKVDQDVVLELQDPNAGTASEDVARFSAAVHEGQRYLMLRYRPRLAGEPVRERRDWVFLFESSGDRDPLLARVQVEVIKTLLENAEHDDTFAILTAGTRVQAMTATAQPATPDNVRAAVAWLDQVHLVGALDLGAALKAAEPFVKVGTNPYLVHVGSGIAAIGERREDVLAKSVPEGAHYVGVGVGKRWSRAFMKAAAESSGGYFTQINPDEPITWRTFELISTLNTPRLLGVSVVDEEEKVSFLRYAGLVAQGEEVCAIARFPEDQPLPKAVTVSGTLDGKTFQRVVPVAKVAEHADYLPRTWAKLEIDRLLAQDAANNKAKIVALSKAMYVMTPFTSLLVLENEQMYQQFHVDRGRKDHWAMYPCPEQIRVVYEPLPNVGFGRKVPQDRTATEEQVLQTVLIRQPPAILYWPNQPRPNDEPVVTALQALQGTVHDEAGRAAESDVVRGLKGGQVQGSFTGPRSAVTADSLENLGVIIISGNNASGVEELLRSIRLAETMNGSAASGGLNPFFPPVPPLRGAPVPQDPKSGFIFSSTAPVPGNSFSGGGFSGSNFAGNGFTGGFGGQFGGALGFGGGFSGQANGGMRASSPFGGSGGFSPFGNLAAFPGGSNASPGVAAGNAATAEPTARKASPSVNVTTVRNFDRELLDTAVRAMQSGKSPAASMPPRRLLEAWARYRTQEMLYKGGGTKLPATSLEDLRAARLAVETAYAEWLSDPSLQPFAYQAPGLLYQQSGLSGARLAATSQADLHAAKSLFEKEYAAWSAGPATPVLTLQPQALLYQRPVFSGNERIFYNLTAYAPGMNTTWADVLAVVEAEAVADPRNKRGVIDPAARKLINKARTSAWKRIVIPDDSGKSDLTLFCNGQGQYLYQRTLDTGLRERVVCDGKTLFHLYPELGVGAQRTVSAYHRDLLIGLVPWLVGPVEDLARGADVKCLDDHTVAIIPRPSSGAPDAPYLCLHLRFAVGGPLSERRVVEMPAGKLVARETYDGNGLVKTFDADGKTITDHRYTVEAASAPNVVPDLKDLVVLPLPYRSSAFVRQSLKTVRTYGQKAYLDLDRKDALRLFAAELASHQVQEALAVYQQCFQQRGDGRLGFYVLLADAGHNINGFANPRKDARDDPLDRYLRVVGDAAARQNCVEIGVLPGPRDGFLQRLAAFHDVCSRWASGRVQQGGQPGLRAEVERALKFIRSEPDRLRGWVILDTVKNYLTNNGLAVDVPSFPEVYRLFEQVPGLHYVARYEYACSLLAKSRGPEAVPVFRDLYTETLKAGRLPPIDASFRTAFVNNLGEEGWGRFIEQAADTLIAATTRPGVIALAWQLRQLGDSAIADGLVARALAGLSGPQTATTTLAAVGYLGQAGEMTQAEAALKPLLDDPTFAQNAPLWRLAAWTAGQRDSGWAAIPYLEKALDLEYAHLPEFVNLQAIRQDYGALLAHYQTLASAIHTMGATPPSDFLARVVRAADHWRSLDPDGTAACQAAAQVLKALGETDLAWDYLTTPIGQRPNQAAPWLSLAQALRNEGSLNLAERAYGLAFEAEPTNAQILWDRALLLQQVGRRQEAQMLYRQLAEGQWQPRFQWLQNQARQQLQVGSR